MSRLCTLFPQIRLQLERPAAVERELDEQLRFHIEMQVEENARRGGT